MADNERRELPAQAEPVPPPTLFRITPLDRGGPTGPPTRGLPPAARRAHRPRARVPPVDYRDKLPPSPWDTFAPPRRYIFTPPLTPSEYTEAKHHRHLVAKEVLRSALISHRHEFEHDSNQCRIVEGGRHLQHAGQVGRAEVEWLDREYHRVYQTDNIRSRAQHPPWECTAAMSQAAMPAALVQPLGCLVNRLPLTPGNASTYASIAPDSWHVFERREQSAVERLGELLQRCNCCDLCPSS